MFFLGCNFVYGVHWTLNKKIFENLKPEHFFFKKTTFFQP